MSLSPDAVTLNKGTKKKWHNLFSKKLAIEVIKFLLNCLFSGLKISNKIAGIGVKKGVQMALCGMAHINLMDHVIKILGIYFSYNKKLEQEKYFLNHIVTIQTF